MKKRILALIFSLTLAVSMVSGCGSDSSDNASASGEAASSEAGTSDSESNDDSSDVSNVSVDEQVLYDENDIKITATGLEEGWLGTDMKLTIENNTDKDITVQNEWSSVNGYMVSTTMSVDVAAGKKANDTLTFDSSSLEECGIEQIATMEIVFSIIDADSWDDIAKSDVITVNTSVNDGYEQAYDDSGDVIVDQDGIKIVSKGVSTDDSIWGPGVVLYVENNSDKNITIQTRDVSINGYMVDASMSEDVVAGKKAMTAVQFFDSDLEDNGIEDITDAELSFDVFDMDSWDDIFETDAISLTF